MLHPMWVNWHRQDEIDEIYKIIPINIQYDLTFCLIHVGLLLSCFDTLKCILKWQKLIFSFHSLKNRWDTWCKSSWGLQRWKTDYFLYFRHFSNNFCFQLIETQDSQLDSVHVVNLREMMPQREKQQIPISTDNKYIMQVLNYDQKQS